MTPCASCGGESHTALDMDILSERCTKYHNDTFRFESRYTESVYRCFLHLLSQTSLACSKTPIHTFERERTSQSD